MLLRVGTAALIVNVAALDVPPASVTVTLAEPEVAIRLPGTAAVSCVALTKVVVSAVPPQFTVAPEIKFVPFTVRVNAEPPAVAAAGERLAIVGAAALIAKVAAGEVPAESFTVTLAVPAVAIRLAGTAAVNCVALTNVVVNAVLPHCTVAPEIKFAPFTVRANAAPPAVADEGERLVIVGGAWLIVNVAPVDVPPELVTVTVAEPAVAIRLAGTSAVSCVELT
jgi:hypothetical protein